MPGGEVFYSPVEDSAERRDRVLASSRRSTTAGRSKASGSCSTTAASSTRSARSGEAFLIDTLDSDEGARRLGELGIGCNPGIQRFMKNVALRREDRRHDPPRSRQLVHVHRRHEQERDPLGHRQGPAQRRPALRRRQARAGRRSLAASDRRLQQAAAISPARRAFPTIRSRFAASVRPPLSRCR